MGRQEPEDAAGASGRTLLAQKRECAWSIPRGELNEGEDAELAARRESQEETGAAPSGPIVPLGEIRQRGGKRVIALAAEGDLDVRTIRSDTFEIEWPPKNRAMQSFPENDRAEWSTCNRLCKASRRPAFLIGSSNL